MTQEMQRCIETCMESAEECRVCADVCSGMDGMEQCREVCIECADTCERTVNTMREGSNADCAPCAEMCDRCADECEKHDHAAMRQCARVCRECADACRASANTPPESTQADTPYEAGATSRFL